MGKQMDQHLSAGFHIFDRDIFKSAMEVSATGAQIGARQTHITEPGAVGAASDGYRHGIHAHGLHGLHCPLHHIHMGLDLAAHIIVAVTHGKTYRPLAVASIERRHRTAKILLFAQYLLSYNCKVTGSNYLNVQIKNNFLICGHVYYNIQVFKNQCF